MTAIFAYAHEGTAFVAGDSWRVSPNGKITVCKIYQWSEGVVFAQAGEAQFLTQLIGKIRPLMGHYPPTVEGLIDSFQQLNEVFWKKAEAAYKARGRTVTEGTLLVASVSTPVHPARIFKLDFQTGTPTLCVGSIAADGTNADQFESIATQQFAEQGPTGVQLDSWASRCVMAAAKSYPNYIGFPVDVLIARQIDGHRVTVQQRLHSEDTPPNHLFAAS